MNLRQSKSVLLIFSYVFVMFLLPYVTLYGISALFFLLWGQGIFQSPDIFRANFPML